MVLRQRHSMRAFRRLHQRDAPSNPLSVFWLPLCHLWPRNGEKIRWTTFALSASTSSPSARRIPSTRCGKSHAQSAWCTAAPILRTTYRRPTKSPIICVVRVLRFKWRRSLTRPTSERLHTQKSACLFLPHSFPRVGLFFECRNSGSMLYSRSSYYRFARIHHRSPTTSSLPSRIS